jgi:NAD(P)-dependent dehydrogenase (short-subunit alcohol dehydrogenase family)
MENNSLKGKICMITGANSGIGKETALGLAKLGATVVMVCRNPVLGKDAQDWIKKMSGNSSIDLLLADLSSQQAVRDLVSEFRSKYDQLHVLINNAGAVIQKRTLTVDGLETTFAVNYLAPYLLTNLLLDVLKASAPARVINVTSGLHKRASIDFDDLQSEKRYGGFWSYNKAKLAFIHFTYHLSKELDGTGVTVNIFNPGVARTNLGRDTPWYMRWAVIFFKNPRKCAETPIYLASAPELEGITGKYFENKRETRSSEASYDEVIAAKLWQVSTQLTNLST